DDSVDEGTVRALLIGDDPRPILAPQAGVLRRHRRTGEHEVVAGRSSDRDLVTLELSPGNFLAGFVLDAELDHVRRSPGGGLLLRLALREDFVDPQRHLRKTGERGIVTHEERPVLKLEILRVSQQYGELPPDIH